jgi:transcriptional regulator with XRE-family HTH domain
MRFGERLRELRESAGLTQQQLADAAGVPVGSIRNYEQGHREPYWNVVYRLVPALGVNCDAFQQCVQPLLASEPAPVPKKKGKSSKIRKRQEGKIKTTQKRQQEEEVA